MWDPHSIPTATAKINMQEVSDVNTLSFRARQETDSQIDKTVSKVTEQLRSVNAVFEDLIQCEAVLDTGSQIIAMRSDVWKKLGILLKTEYSMSMESANATSSSTKGLAERVKVSIGGIDLYLNIQVVENAPYQVLLGRPFHTLVKAQTQDYEDSDQDITITEPGTGQTITLPTYPHRQVPPNKRNASGFQ